MPQTVAVEKCKKKFFYMLYNINRGCMLARVKNNLYFCGLFWVWSVLGIEKWSTLKSKRKRLTT